MAASGFIPWRCHGVNEKFMTGLCWILELLHTQQLTIDRSLLIGRRRPTITRRKTLISSTDSWRQVRPINGHLEFASHGRLTTLRRISSFKLKCIHPLFVSSSCVACCATSGNCKCPPWIQEYVGCRPFSIWWISLSLRSRIQICPY